MQLTRKQEEGLKIATDRYYYNEKWTCISGYAGTGKSTLVKFIIASIGLPQEDVVYATFTGKASLVLRQKGNANSMTLHKLLYNSFKKRDGTFAHIPKKELDYPYKIVVVDEISMVPNHIWELLMKHQIHVICLGDPFQLPPVGEDNGILASPHVFLDEIMRQETESEIIRLTMDIRAGKPLQCMRGSEVQVIQMKDVVTGLYDWADQIICGRNATRHAINSQMRHMKGFGENPQENDKVICLKNEWETLNDNEDVLINGSIGHLFNIKIGTSQGVIGTPMTADFIPDPWDISEEDNWPADMAFRQLKMDYKLLTEGNPTLQRGDYNRFPRELIPKQFNYGYAITCHKSQGSEYDKVLVFEEVLRRDTHARWLYTAATRAVDKLVIIRKN